MGADITNRQRSAAGIVLLSEDGDLVDSLSTLLKRLEIPTHIVTTAPDALSRLEQDEHPVLVVDADGRSLEASDLVTTVRKSYPDRIVIVVTAEASVDLLIPLLRAGIYDFLQKPVDLLKLSSTIRFACQRQVVSELSAEIYDKLRSSTALLDQNQVELYREAFRITEELQSLNKALRRHVSQLTILYQMGRDISENENWSDALDRFLMALVNYMRADGAALLLFSERERRLSPRANFQIDVASLEVACELLLGKWRTHPRGTEIHSLESYTDGRFTACLESAAPWKVTLIPLRHRNRALGFLFLEKSYATNQSFRIDYHFLNTVQTIFAEEVANASYISELRQLSRFNEKILENINSGVITTDIEGNVRFLNKRARSLCPRLTEAKHIHFDDVFRSETFGHDFYRKIIQSKKDTHFIEVECLGSEREAFPARLSTTKMHDDNLNGNVVVAIFDDLTEQKRMEAEIRKNDRLRALGQLSAGVAHEIRNPLTGIATSVEVLNSKLKGDKEKAKYIRVALDEINRLDGIIRNLLTFAKPPRPHMVTCSLPEIAGRVISLLSEQARKKGIEVALVEKLEVERCRADPDQLTQVLLNILLNAVQACGKGDRIEVILRDETETGTGGHRRARVDIVDSGPGVPEAIRKSLFEPFVTTKARGTGLGLAISRQIIEEHDGKILCDFPSVGTRVSVILPVAPSQTSIGSSHARAEGG